MSEHHHDWHLAEDQPESYPKSMRWVCECGAVDRTDFVPADVEVLETALGLSDLREEPA